MPCVGFFSNSADLLLQKVHIQKSNMESKPRVLSADSK